ncbi:hypothetical protein RUM44_006025 [Polyplax serrata]|uniref:Uncharacterized protein n=1 Tax=Polyplax serrata TaxID=468196 RepID=A0ABR1AYR5_POLSC
MEETGKAWSLNRAVRGWACQAVRRVEAAAFTGEREGPTAEDEDRLKGRNGESQREKEREIDNRLVAQQRKHSAAATATAAVVAAANATSSHHCSPSTTPLTDTTPTAAGSPGALRPSDWETISDSEKFVPL